MKLKHINAQINEEDHKTLKLEAVKLGIPIATLWVNILRREAQKLRGEE
jgi:hypothetical protein